MSNLYKKRQYAFNRNHQNHQINSIQMQLPSLSSIAISMLVAANAATMVQAKVNVLSWDDAYKKADALVSQMSLEQKINITTGVGWGS